MTALLGGLLAAAIAGAAPTAAQTGCYSWTPVPATSSVWTDGAYRYWTLEAGGELFVFEDPAVPQELATGNGLDIDLVTKCATLPDPTPTPTSPPAATPTSVPTSTPAPTATPTVSPASTPTPAPTATPDPAATPSTPAPTPVAPTPGSGGDDTPAPEADDGDLGRSPQTPTSTPDRGADAEDTDLTFGALIDPDPLDDEVAGVGVAQEGDEDTAGAVLAFTGSDSRTVAGAGALLVAIGVLAVGQSRRRTAA